MILLITFHHSTIEKIEAKVVNLVTWTLIDAEIDFFSGIARGE